jgi:hypothetical protein
MERSDGQLQRIDVSDLEILAALDQREHAIDVWDPAQENESTTGPPGTDAGVDDRMHADSVDEREFAEIEYDQLGLQARLAERVLQLRHRRQIELAA